jgi:hypothetical protein
MYLLLPVESYPQALAEAAVWLQRVLQAAPVAGLTAAAAAAGRCRVDAWTRAPLLLLLSLLMLLLLSLLLLSLLLGIAHMLWPAAVGCLGSGSILKLNGCLW